MTNGHGHPAQHDDAPELLTTGKALDVVGAVVEGEVVDLPARAQRANHWHAKTVAAQRNMVEYAIRSGKELLAAKAECKHGTWMAWVETEFDGSLSLANKYMKLARNSERVTNLDPDTSLREALHAIDYLAGLEPKNPSGWQKGQPCLWGGGYTSDPMGTVIDLPLRPTPAAMPGPPEDYRPEPWVPKPLSADEWKKSLPTAACNRAIRDADSAVTRLLDAAHRDHQPGDPDADAKTQTRLVARISEWRELLAAIDARLRDLASDTQTAGGGGATATVTAAAVSGLQQPETVAPLPAWNWKTMK
jgi:Protein of unknown function (DUF3102)